MNPRPFAHRVLRWLIRAGLSSMCIGGCVAGTADGFGDSPPPITQSAAQKRTGVAILATGAAAAFISAVALYFVENKNRP